MLARGTEGFVSKERELRLGMRLLAQRAVVESDGERGREGEMGEEGEGRMGGEGEGRRGGGREEGKQKDGRIRKKEEGRTHTSVSVSLIDSSVREAVHQRLSEPLEDHQTHLRLFGGNEEQGHHQRSLRE